MTNSILNQLFGNNAEREFGLNKFKPEEKAKILQRIEERMQTVVVETAVAMMTDEQFEKFQAMIENNTDHQIIQQEILALAKEMPGLIEALKQNVIKEADALKKIINAPQ